jgi:hypothetical protein
MPQFASDWTLILEQGVDATKVVVYRDSNRDPITVAGGLAYMQVRPNYGSSEVLLDLSTANGKIVLGAALGTLTLSFLGADTLGIDLSKAQLMPIKVPTKCGFRDVRCAKIGVHDLYFVNAAGKPVRLTKGVAYLSPMVSRPEGM